MKMLKIELHWQILISMALGIGFALIISNFVWGKDFILNWIKPFGTIFINSLKLIAVPLILASLIKGVSDLKDVSQLSKIGLKTVALFLTTTFIAVCLGLLLANIIKPGNAISEKTRNELVANYSKDVSSKMEKSDIQKQSGPLQSLIEIVPENAFLSTTDNKNMLQVIFISILFGVAMVMIPESAVKPIRNFVDSINLIILKIIDIIMKFAPYGVFALLSALVIEAPNIDLFIALAIYAITILIGLVLMLCLYIILVKVFTNKSPSFFLKGIAPAQLLAFSTSSSGATLPVTMERTEKHLGVSKDICGFVLPIGATVNMDGTSLYQAVAAVFIAQAFGIELSLGTQIGIILTATLASIGTASVPGAGMVMLLIVLAQAGIPEAGLALILAIDRPLDMCRTVVNVSSDVTVSMMIAKSEGKLL